MPGRHRYPNVVCSGDGCTRRTQAAAGLCPDHNPDHPIHAHGKRTTRPTSGRAPQPCAGGCGRRVERPSGECIACEAKRLDVPPAQVMSRVYTTTEYALTGGRWVRRGLVWAWEWEGGASSAA